MSRCDDSAVNPQHARLLATISAESFTELRNSPL